MLWEGNQHASTKPSYFFKAKRALALKRTDLSVSSSRTIETMKGGTSDDEDAEKGEWQFSMPARLPASSLALSQGGSASPAGASMRCLPRKTHNKSICDVQRQGVQLRACLWQRL